MALLYFTNKITLLIEERGYAMKQAKHEEIQSYIKKRIMSGSYPVGHQIETEVQLCEKFKVSRQTVNKALQSLANDGYIDRKRGKGSFVIGPFVQKSMRRHTSFTKDLESVGIKPGSRLLKYDYISAKDEPEVASALRLAESDFLHYFIRLRTGDNIPIAISYSYLSAQVVPEIDFSALSYSQDKMLQDMNIHHRRAIYQLSACSPTEAQMKLLEIEHHTALFRNHHITFNQYDIPYEYVDTYYIGSKYTYNIEVSTELSEVQEQNEQEKYK